MTPVYMAAKRSGGADKYIPFSDPHGDASLNLSESARKEGQWNGYYCFKVRAVYDKEEQGDWKTSERRYVISKDAALLSAGKAILPVGQFLAADWTVMVLF